VIGGLGTPSEFASAISWPTTAGLTTYADAFAGRAKEMGMQSVCLLLVNVNFIQPVDTALKASMQKNGITVKDDQQVDPTKQDYTDVVLRFSQQDGCNSVVAALDPFSYSRLFQAEDRQNYHPKFVGLGLDKGTANQAYNANGSHAVWNASSQTPLIEPWDHPNEPHVADYLGTVKKYFPNQVGALDIYTEQQWVAAEVFVEAIKRIGAAAVNRQTLASALNSIANFDVGLMKPITYTAGSAHDPDRCFQTIDDHQGNWATTSDWHCF
jgi:hypothetical protein